MYVVLEVMLNSHHRSLGSVPGQSVWSAVYHLLQSGFSVSIAFKPAVPQEILTIACHLHIRSATTEKMDSFLISYYGIPVSGWHQV
jgi:hypothetical protein